MRTRTGSRLGRFVAVGAGAALVVGALLAAGPASAHNYPVSSSPAEGATVTEQPGTISLTTNDNLLGFGNGSAMEVSGPSDDPRYYGDGCSQLLGPTIELDAQLGKPGTYTVTWQVVSTDGHPVSGSYTFEWQPSAGQTLADGSAKPPTCATAAPGAPTEAPAATTKTVASNDAALGDILWIGVALAAIIVAAGVTLLVLRRRTPREGEGDDGDDDADGGESTASEDPRTDDDTPTR